MTDWRTEANCHQIPNSIYFPDERGRKDWRTHLAISICNACPVVVDCLHEAIETGDNEWGIRGGKTPGARRHTRRKVRLTETAGQRRQTLALDALTCHHTRLRIADCVPVTELLAHQSILGADDVPVELLDVVNINCDQTAICLSRGHWVTVPAKTQVWRLKPKRDRQ
jgi:hypothetical protein